MKKCHACGHEDHKTMAEGTALVHRPSDPPGAKVWIRRYWCHENDHSCYNENRGRYFADLGENW